MMDRRDFGMAAMAALLAGGALAQQPAPDAPPPGGRKGRGPRGGMGPGFGRPDESSFLGSKPQAADPKEKQILDVITGMLSRRGISVPEDDGRFLRTLVEFSGAKNVVEIGTYQGMSALWFCMALRQTGGKLITHDIDPEIAKAAQENFKKAGVEDLVTLVIGDAHEKVKDLEGPIDLLFQDADKEGYLDYLEKLLPKIRPGGLIISHNINPRQSDPAYLKRLTTDPKLDTILVSMQQGGISVTLKKRG